MYIPDVLPSSMTFQRVVPSFILELVSHEARKVRSKVEMQTDEKGNPYQ
jgi:hypothetical protein